MRNLRNTHRTVLWSPGGLSLTATGWDVGTESIICAFGPTEKEQLLQLKRWHSNQSHDGQELEHVVSWDAPCPLPDLLCDKILDLHHFSDSSITCIVLAGGDIVVVRESPPEGEEKIEIVGSVDVGISAAAWSPDEELLAITTRADTLLFMSRDFDNVSDATLGTDDLNASKHVSVGWGKKETQFKGKGAKALRDPTMPERVDEGILSSHDDGNTTISWRGDGAYVAMNSIQASSRRVIRVYSREGLLDGVSEPVDGLESALSWRPAGNLLAGIQRYDDRIEVVFFERNGLRHGQFPLRISKEEMGCWASSILLKWNSDSSVLAVCFLDRVQLWTMGNYHYYLKQEILFPKKSQTRSPVVVHWHPERSLDFTIDCKCGLNCFEYVSEMSAGPTAPPDDYGVVAVIDGKYLNITPFRVANVPPPMSLQRTEVSSNIVATAISGKGADVRIAILERTWLSVYQWDLKMKAVGPVSLLASIDIQPFMMNDFAQQVAFSSRIELLVLTSDETGCLVHSFLLAPSGIQHIKSSPRPYIKGVTTISADSLRAVYLHGYSSGEVVADPNILDTQEDGVQSPKVVLATLPNQTSEIKVVRLDGGSARQLFPAEKPTEDETIVFSLTTNGTLSANNCRLAKDCTSFLVTPLHLLYTTTQHLLKLVHVASAQELEVPPDTPEVDERCRSIERGAKLVTVIPNTSAVILQMPRGNLETIYPRALVLAGIRQSVDALMYKTAFLSCRSHRVDMNILYDYSPEEFISNVNLFVDQVVKVEHIDLFLSQLLEEDVSSTMYRDTLKRQAHDESLTRSKAARNGLPSSKVNTICDAFLKVLRPRMSTNLQNVITSHLCKIPPDLDAGLLEVDKLWRSDPDEAEKAVEHICFLADVNRLYDHALGLYNLDLALLFAQQSQKDPREYLPFLQGLHELSPIRRNFAIDDHLGRYKKAMAHLNGMSRSDEFIQYMVKHHLYEEALYLRRRDEETVTQIMGLFAGFLSRKSRHKEAAIAHEYTQDYAAASKAYTLAQLWREALACASLVPLENDGMEAHVRHIERFLLELKDYHSAAIINLDYLHDIESAASLFCKGYFFADAIRILSLSKRLDLVDTVVDVGLAEGLGTMTQLLADCKNQLNAQVPYLRELRIKKAEEPLSFYDGDVHGGADIPDNVSLAATDTSTTGGNSLLTRYTDRTGTVGTNTTRRTSKHKKREERKRARGKKGTIYEEEYLVVSVGRLIERVNSVNEDIGKLVVGLMRRGMRERAIAVQEAMVEVVELCKSCVEEVFQTGKHAGEEGTKHVDEDVNRPSGGDGVLWDSVETSLDKKEPPQIKEFEVLSLLGRR